MWSRETFTDGCEERPFCVKALIESGADVNNTEYASSLKQVITFKG